MSKVSMKGLEDALSLVQRVEATRAAEISTAQDALGPAYAMTVVELARVTTAARTTELLVAIRDLADRLLGAPPASSTPAAVQQSVTHGVAAPVAQTEEPQVSSRQRVFMPPQPKAAERAELFGVPFPASRREEADDVVAQVRRALAQGHKTNPFESYRGKNQWCKKLFEMAYAALSADPASDVDATSESPDHDAATPPPPAPAPDREVVPAAAPVGATRSSVAMSAPARGSRQRFIPPSPPPPSTAGSVPRDPASGRRFGMGVVTQTLDPEVIDSSAPARQSFYKRKR